MPKLKSKKAATKRFKVTGSGKVKASKANRRHILASKTAKRKRQSRSGFMLNDTDAKRILSLLLK